jgi:YD repeat-containing protein
MNNANQRTTRTDADGSYWDYGYDSLGQVTNAVRRWSDGTPVTGQQYGYLFDDIGNRQWSVISDQTSVYTANLLNQYAQRTVPDSFWEMGSAHSNATVTVNQAVAARQGEYFAAQLALANSNSAVYTAVVTVATLTTTNGEPVQATSSSAALTSTGTSSKPEWLYNEKGQLIKRLPNGKEKVMPSNAGGNNVSNTPIMPQSEPEQSSPTTISVSLTNTGHAFLPMTPEQFDHDSDGSLTNDGRWAYSWDGENRLIGMETLPNLPTNVPV